MDSSFMNRPHTILVGLCYKKNIIAPISLFFFSNPYFISFHIKRKNKKLYDLTPYIITSEIKWLPKQKKLNGGELWTFFSR